MVHLHNQEYFPNTSSYLSETGPLKEKMSLVVYMRTAKPKAARGAQWLSGGVLDLRSRESLISDSLETLSMSLSRAF